MIGAASLTANELREGIRRVRDHTDRPFGVDILFATVGRAVADPTTARFTREVEAQIDVVFDEHVPVLASGLGNPARRESTCQVGGVERSLAVAGPRFAPPDATRIGLTVRSIFTEVADPAGGEPLRLPHWEGLDGRFE